MAQAFRAHDASGQVVFLKRVRLNTPDEAALQRENDVYGRLQYQQCNHVLSVLDFQRDGEFAALITEYADGGDLKHFVEAAEPSGPAKGLPPHKALVIALEIARGLAELHESNIVHRDLKPDNVLRVGAVWKLADFGIAKNRAREGGGVTFQQAGTYGYAAPEQFDGSTADPSADIYSFGKILSYLLTGNTDPDRIRVELPDLRRLVQRCSQYAPESRPTIADVLAGLEPMLGVPAT